MATAIDDARVSTMKTWTDSPIVISGVGLVTSLGQNARATFARLCDGHSGVREDVWRLPKFGMQPWAGFPVYVPATELDPHWPDPVFSILKSATTEALQDAGLALGAIDPGRTGVVIGLSKGAVRLQGEWAADPLAMHKSPAARRLGLMATAPSAGATYVSELIGGEGPILAPITACATGLTAVRHAAELLKQGACDIAIAGAADASLEPMMYAAFTRMKSLAGPAFEGEPPQAWIKPWSARRDGFLIGEGGAVFVLEREADLTRCGRRAIARVTGMAAGAEAHHATRPRSDAELLTRVIRESLSHGQAVDAVHLHATATRGYDPLEAEAVGKALENDASAVWMLASKPQLGHCLGAAGAVELAICCESLRRQTLPPFDPEPTGEFPRPGRPVGRVARRERIGSILKVVAGFGGHLEACRLEHV